MARNMTAVFNNHGGSVFLANANNSFRGNSLVDTGEHRSEPCAVCNGSGTTASSGWGGFRRVSASSSTCEVCEGRGTILTERSILEADSAPHGGMSGSQLTQRMGVTREHSVPFQELRKLFLQRSVSLAGPRHEDVKRIVADQDDKALTRFVESGRATTPDFKAEACAWCNSRIALRSNAASGAGVGKVCRLCLRWHCEACRSHVEDLGSLVGSSTARRPSFVQGLKGLGATDLKCCSKCRSFVQALRWHKLPREIGLPLSSVQLLQIHVELESRMTSFASALSQFEGLSRTVEEVGQSTDLPSDFTTILVEHQQKAIAAQAAVEAAVRQAGQIECPPPPHRDGRVRDALVRHGKGLLEELKPRLLTTQKRAQPAVMSRPRSLTS